MTDEEKLKPDTDRVQMHVNQLMEHFDTVQIFTTRVEQGTEGGTVNVNLGAGNWFARYGHVRMWLKREEERPAMGDGDGSG